MVGHCGLVSGAGAVVKNVVGPDLAVPLIDSPSEMV
ncbi:hypothetical protein GZL_01361 [Streptomyces sp. 769]|nr:hypothetical protein GZL_01361 [Streptomyces sp. 769]